MIRLKGLKMEIIHKIWGIRVRILKTEQTETDILYLKPNTFCSTHNHENKINKFYVVKGKVRIRNEYGFTDLIPGQSWTVEPPIVHRFEALEESQMIETAFVKEGKIDPEDICRISQGGKKIREKEITLDEMRETGLLEL